MLPQLRVLRFGLLQDGDVRVGVFPEGKEVSVSGFRFGCVARERIGTGKAEMSQRCYRRVPRYTPVIQDLLELLRRVSALLRSQIRLATQVNGVEKEDRWWNPPLQSQFVRKGCLKEFDRLSGIVTASRDLSMDCRQPNVVEQGGIGESLA